MIIWRSKHAAGGAAALVVMTGLCGLLGEEALAALLWIPAAALTLIYMVSEDDGEN